MSKEETKLAIEFRRPPGSLPNYIKLPNAVQTDNLKRLAKFVEDELTPDQLLMESFFHGESTDGSNSLGELVHHAQESGVSFESCYTSACLIGWSAVLFPDIAVEHNDFRDLAHELYGESDYAGYGTAYGYGSYLFHGSNSNDVASASQRLQNVIGHAEYRLAEEMAR